MTKQTTKRGPFSKEEREYIEKSKSKSSAYIAKKLNRSQDSVEQYLNKTAEENIEAEPEPDQEQAQEPVEVKESLAMSLMARNEKYGAVIMTENASMISDDSRRARAQKGRSPVSSRYKSAIHVINPNKPTR